MIGASVGPTMRWSRALLLHYVRQPRSIATHGFIAVLFGFVALPGPEAGFATFSVGGHHVAYTPASVGVILGALFAAIYPAIALILFAGTFPTPLPQSLIGVFPRRQSGLIAGRVVIIAMLLGLQAVLMTLSAVLRAFHSPGLATLPETLLLFLVIALPSLSFAALLTGFVTQFRDTGKGPILISLVLWIVWVSGIGLSLAWPFFPDIAGLRLPLAALLGTAALKHMSIGVIAAPIGGEPFRVVNNLFLPTSFYVRQLACSIMLLVVPTVLAFRWVHVAQPRATARSRPHRPAACGYGFQRVGLSPAWGSLFWLYIRWLAKGRWQILALPMAVTLEFLLSDPLSGKVTLAVWGLLLKRWAELSDIAVGRDFFDIRTTLTIGRALAGVAAACAIFRQMMIFSIGSILAGHALPIIFSEMTVVSVVSVSLTYVTRSSTPFLILGFIAWYGLISA